MVFSELSEIVWAQKYCWRNTIVKSITFPDANEQDHTAHMIWKRLDIVDLITVATFTSRQIHLLKFGTYSVFKINITHLKYSLKDRGKKKVKCQTTLIQKIKKKLRFCDRSGVQINKPQTLHSVDFDSELYFTKLVS